MRRSRIDSLPTCGAGLDTETFAITLGNLAPRVVCGSIAALIDKLRGEILSVDQVVHAFRALLANPNAIIVGANIVFDLLALAVECERRGVDVMPEIFAALECDRVYCVQVQEALSAVAEGCLGRDPRTGGQLTNPETGKRGRYSLSTCVDLVLGRLDAKANDEWRLRYGELADVPMALWPRPALDYPVDDAVNTLEVALAQAGHVPSTGVHRWTSGGPGTEVRCTRCGLTPEQVNGACVAVARERNMHDLSNQVWTAFAMHAGAARGFHVNQDSVDVIERHAMLRHADGSDAKFVAAGILRTDGTQDLSETKRRVAVAYGAKDPCGVCAGTGKVLSPKAPLRGCPTCKGKPIQVGLFGNVVVGGKCSTCQGVGKIKNPKALICCALYEPNGLDEPIKVKTCDGTGLLLTDDVPRSEKEGVGYGRDVLSESGDELLMDYAEWDADKKDLTVFVPYLRKGRGCLSCRQPGTAKLPHLDTCTWPPFLPRQYADVPLTLRANVVLETGRVSYDDVIQLFKRAPGHVDDVTKEYIPSLRECVQARKGWVLGSVDYEAGELITHAQSCIWITGRSLLGAALLGGVKPHNALAATMIGQDYEAFQKLLKSGDKLCVDSRQAAKPPNFGYPGGMGAPKLVLQQRAQGPDTPCPCGPSMVENEAGDMVPGYKGLRFCILMDGAEACGIEKRTSWHERPIPPTCVACIKCAERLKQIWLRQWPENEPYFKFVGECVEYGQVVTREMLDRWPHLREVFRPGERMSPGEIVQHVSGRIRGGGEFCAIANGFFQGLLADAAKAATRRVSRECYDRTIRVPTLAHENSKPSAYAGGPSPLLGSRLIVFQHDEVLPELPESVAHDAITRVSEVLVDELRYYCPDMADACAAEPTLMRKWFKSAKMIKDSKGHVIPWEPGMK